MDPDQLARLVEAVVQEMWKQFSDSIKQIQTSLDKIAATLDEIASSSGE